MQTQSRKDVTKPTALQCVNSLLYVIDDIVKAHTVNSKRMLECRLDIAILTFLNTEVLNSLDEYLEQLIYINYNNVRKETMHKLLSLVPLDHKYYKQVRGKIMFTLCINTPYTTADEYLNSVKPITYFKRNK